MLPIFFKRATERIGAAPKCGPLSLFPFPLPMLTFEPIPFFAPRTLLLLTLLALSLFTLPRFLLLAQRKSRASIFAIVSESVSP